MSPERQSAVEILALIAEIRDDLDAMRRLLAQIAELRSRISASSEPDPKEIMSAAGFLHHLYTAMESIAERVVAYLDGTVPTGERWHQELLTRIGLSIPGVRSALVTEHTRSQLARLLRFRHFFRHAYRIDLLWSEVAPLMKDADAIANDFSREVEAFSSALAKTAERMEP
jgi:hypothetical protein